VLGSGNYSARLQYFSTTGVDSGGLEETRKDGGKPSKSLHEHLIKPEVAHWRAVGFARSIKFDSRRLHQFTR
jgi:hypothetical protein